MCSAKLYIQTFLNKSSENMAIFYTLIYQSRKNRQIFAGFQRDLLFQNSVEQALHIASVSCCFSILSLLINYFFKFLLVFQAVFLFFTKEFFKRVLFFQKVGSDFRVFFKPISVFIRTVQPDSFLFF